MMKSNNQKKNDETKMIKNWSGRTVHLLGTNYGYKCVTVRSLHLGDQAPQK